MKYQYLQIIRIFNAQLEQQQKKKKFYFLMETQSVPVFLTKLFNIVQEKLEEETIKFDPTGKILILVNQDRLVNQVLPDYFGHKNLPSFLRQMNMYGFKKRRVGDQIEFKHKSFKRNAKAQLINIKRRNEVETDQVSQPINTDTSGIQQKLKELQQMTQKVANQNIVLLAHTTFQQKALIEHSQINHIRFQIITDQIQQVIRMNKQPQQADMNDRINYQQQQSLQSLEYMMGYLFIFNKIKNENKAQRISVQGFSKLTILNHFFVVNRQGNKRESKRERREQKISTKTKEHV
ncbi:hypothetical protein pb186bvf_009478 [Paramecium bursaria]